MRAKKSLKNLIFNIFQQMISVLTGFLLPPLIVANYGSAINGLISTIRQIVMYVQTTGAGIASASTYEMYKPLAEKNNKKLSAIFNATKKMFIKAGNISSLLILIIAFIYPLFVKNDVDVFTTIALIIMLGACGVSEFYFIGKYQALFSADQKNYLVSIAQGLGNLFNIVISIVLIKLKCNIIFVEFGAMAVYITRVVFLWNYFVRHYKQINKTVPPKKDGIPQRKDAVIHEVTALVVNNSSILLISLFVSLKYASVFSVYMLIFSGLNMICSIVSNGIYASFGDVVAKKEEEVLQKSYDVFEWGFLVMIFALYTITAILLMPFIELYTKNMTDINYVLPTLGILLVLVGLTNNIKIPARTLVIASGHFKQTKKYSVIEMLINLIGQFVFIQFFGIYGAMIGCLLSSIYRGINFIWYANKYILNISHKRVLKRSAILTAVFVAILLVSTLYIHFNISNYLMWLIYAIGITAIIGGIYLGIGIAMDKKAFRESTRVLKSILGK